MDMAAILVMWHKPFVFTFIIPCHGGSTWNFGFSGPSGLWGKEVWKCYIWVHLDEGQWMTLTFDSHKGSCTHLVDCIDYTSLKKSIVLPFFQDQIWPCHKIGQGQPRVIIYILGSTHAPHDAYQVSRSSAFWFREEDFLRFLPYMGMAAIFVMWPGLLEHTFAPCEIWLWLAQWFLRRRCLKSVDDNDGCLPIP